jgi:hypothetical protein
MKGQSRRQLIQSCFSLAVDWARAAGLTNLDIQGYRL